MEKTITMPLDEYNSIMEKLADYEALEKIVEDRTVRLSIDIPKTFLTPSNYLKLSNLQKNQFQLVIGKLGYIVTKPEYIPLELTEVKDAIEKQLKEIPWLMTVYEAREILHKDLEEAVKVRVENWQKGNELYTEKQEFEEAKKKASWYKKYL